MRIRYTQYIAYYWMKNEKKSSELTVSQTLLSTVTLVTDDGNQTTLRHSGKPWQLRKNLKSQKYKYESYKHTYKLIHIKQSTNNQSNKLQEREHSKGQVEACLFVCTV